MIRQKIKNLLQRAVKELQEEEVLPKFEISEIKVEHPAEKIYGDYSTNIAMVICRSRLTPIFTRKDAEKLTPIKLAHILVARLKTSKESHYQFEKIEVAPPGFINFFLSEKALIEELKRAVKEKQRYGSCKIGRGEKVIVDYSSPNIAKPFGIGHLRSTIIGQAIYNIYRFLGYKTIGDNHLGDWGAQFGKLIAAIKKWKKGRANLSIKELEELYVKFHKEAEENPDLIEEGREWFKKLEKGDKEARRIWRDCVKISLEEFKKIYNLLGVKIDYALGESFYEPFLEEVIKEAEKKGIAKKSQGALVVKYPKDSLPPAMLLKSDGATTYFIRDLATIKYRLKRWNPRLIIYEVGAEQQLHFKQLFKAVEMLGWSAFAKATADKPAFAKDSAGKPAFAKASAGKEKRTKLIYIAHGLYRTKTGKFSTRKGGTIHLEEVLNEAVLRAKEVIEKSERGLPKREKERIAKAVGIGAVKYNDLSEQPSKDIVFDWGKILNLKGNSGPYLQYTYARCQSVLRKAKIKFNFKKFESLFRISPAEGKRVLFAYNKEEEDILREFYKFPEVIQEAAEKFSPNIICNFIFQLSQKYNLFYDLYPIIKARDLNKRNFRLALTLTVSQIIKTGLNLLGISAPEKM